MVDHLTDQQDNIDFYRRSNTIDFTETLIPSYNVLNIKQKGRWEIKASCDGLLWFRDSRNRDFVINPITRQMISLPPCPKSNSMDLLFGFGFHPETNAFKLVQISSTKILPFEAHVYTLGSDSSWRNVADVNILYIIHFTCWEVGITCFHGALHWLDYKPYELVIVSFNLGTEEFGEIPLPCGTLPVCTHSYSYLRVLQGCLYFMDASNKKHMEIWVMKEYGVQASWTRLLGGGNERTSYFLKFMHRGEISLQCSNGSLIYYHPKKRELRPIAIESISHVDHPINVLHAESLISPLNISRLKKNVKQFTS